VLLINVRRTRPPCEDDEPWTLSPRTKRAGYRRSTGSKRGEARRRELLDLVIEDLLANGLADFSLRRAARAAGTTHKVLLYYFDGADDLLVQAVHRLRDRRIVNAMDAIGDNDLSLADKLRAVFPAFVGEVSGLRQALDQAMGLAMYDPARYAGLGRAATDQYLPSLLALCPDGWSEARKTEVAQMVLATLRGFLVDWLTSGTIDGAEAGFAALLRAVEREGGSGGVGRRRSGCGTPRRAWTICEPRGSLVSGS